MSLEASAYALNLQRCEDGAELSQAHKLLLLILANHHNPRSQDSWPSLPRLAEQCLCSEDTIRRSLDYLERHCTVLRVKPERQGRKMLTKYLLLGLDRRDLLAKKLTELASGKGSHGATLFSPAERVAEGSQNSPERVAEGSQKPPERVAEGLQKGSKVSGYEIENKESRSGTGTGTKAKGKEELEHHADGGSVSSNGNSQTNPNGNGAASSRMAKALAGWMEIKSALRVQLGEDLWQDLIRPLFLLHVMTDGKSLMVTMPRSTKLAARIRERMFTIQHVAQAHGYAVLLSWYPDDQDMQRMQREYPEIYAQWMNAAKDVRP
ncbi:hypothetical protein Acid345_3184 [Candidatus Koribacter versatilis Ellin345]|uniref:Helix-turn-helix domain-containing protein n=1 Tax=Koribacter versatilis (strain Ellin345) TaxID=204669 RepID=Q1ILR5_KORVE|nr:helix-turn-helix domain-containing protein [Candidatus Koribacter versatilis]ABF42185.1 hypothetical protein Acid345_3184 [Candidatus Koribacter versatilis Ellin345]